MKLYIAVTVDTEEEFNWRAKRFRSQGGSVHNVVCLSRLQSRLYDLGIRVTYFVDYPVLNDATASEKIIEFRDKYNAEIGTHLHPWCTPPYEEELTFQNSAINNLPIELVRRKLENLTDLYDRIFRLKPTSYRAGKFAFSSASAQILADLGYKIDSSVTPFYDWRKECSPNFFFAPHRPYFFDSHNILKEKKGGQLFEVPVTSGFNRRPFDLWKYIYFIFKNCKIGNKSLIGLLYRLNILQRIILSPEIHSLVDMKELVKKVIKEKNQVLNMIFHSSSTIPGGNSFVRNTKDVDRFEERVVQMVSWILQRYNCQPVTIGDLIELY